MERLPEFIANHLFLFSLLAALLALLIWNLFGDSVSGIRAVAPSELTRLVNHENAVVVDLRPQEEFNRGHIINALNYPVSELEAKKAGLNKYKERPMILYCQAGSDSGRVIRAFRHEGFSNCMILKGGLQAWKNAGMPVTRDES